MTDNQLANRPPSVIEQRNQQVESLKWLWDIFNAEGIPDDLREQASQHLLAIDTASQYLLAEGAAWQHVVELLRDQLTELQIQHETMSRLLQTEREMTVESTIRHIIRQVSIETGLTEIQIRWFFDLLRGDGLVDFSPHYRNEVRSLIEDLGWWVEGELDIREGDEEDGD